MTTLILIALGPVALVAVMWLLNRWLKRRKTDILGGALTTLGILLGGVQTADLTFLPDNTEKALLAGSGIAVLLVSRLTERAK